jgi:hypothetical protein
MLYHRTVRYLLWCRLWSYILVLNFFSISYTVELAYQILMALTLFPDFALALIFSSIIMDCRHSRPTLGQVKSKVGISIALIFFKPIYCVSFLLITDCLSLFSFQCGCTTGYRFKFHAHIDTVTSKQINTPKISLWHKQWAQGDWSSWQLACCLSALLYSMCFLYSL